MKPHEISGHVIQVKPDVPDHAVLTHITGLRLGGAFGTVRGFSPRIVIADFNLADGSHILIGIKWGYFEHVGLAPKFEKELELS